MRPRAVLLVYPNMLSKRFGGSSRMLAMARALRDAGFSLILVSKDTQSAAVERYGLFDRICLFKSPVISRVYPGGDRRSHMARSLDVAFDLFALDVAKEYCPFAVITSYAWTAGLLRLLPKTVLGVLDTIDIQHKRLEAAKASGVHQFDRASGKREELNALRKADVLIAIQKDEFSELQRMFPRKHVICATHALSAKPLSSPENSRALLFIGSNYDPNVLGITEFIERTWLQVQAAVPDGELHICGSVCDELTKYRSGPGIYLHGVVDDLEPFYAEAAVVLNVSLYGTGFPIKTSEAIGYGKCLVCNEISARGFERGAFPSMICTSENMAESLIELLQNISARRQREAAAAVYAEHTLSPANVFHEVVDLLTSAAAEIDPDLIGVRRTSVSLFSMLRNYSLRPVLDHYVRLFLSRYYRGPRIGVFMGGPLLNQYIQQRWSLLRYEQNISRVAVYGAGQHSRWLACVLKNQKDVEVVAVIDDHPEQTETLFGLQVTDFSCFDKDTADAVILSSDCIQERLAERCRTLLGDDVKLIDLYEGLPRGPYEKIC